MNICFNKVIKINTHTYMYIFYIPCWLILVCLHGHACISILVISYEWLYVMSRESNWAILASEFIPHPARVLACIHHDGVPG